MGATAIERELRFTDADMAAFAAGSGDRSALHTDPAFAARTAYGECIVYGGLLTLASLGSLPPEARAATRRTQSSYPAPVLPGETLRARAEEHPTRPGVWQVKLTGAAGLAARVIADARPDDRRLDLAEHDGEVRAYPSPELAALAERHGAGELHPAVRDGIGWASYVVGMGMPGFAGLCAAVDVTAVDAGARAGRSERGVFSVVEDDPRSSRRLIDSALLGPDGTARTLVRIECFPIGVTPAAATAR